MQVGIVSLRAQPPCDVYLNDPSMTPCVVPDSWDFSQQSDTIVVQLPPNNDTCEVVVSYVRRRYNDTCSGEIMWEYRVLYWQYVDCSAYQEYADSLRNADPERYRQMFRQQHIWLSNRLNERMVIKDYNDRDSATKLLVHCTEPPPSCAASQQAYHYITAFVSSCVEYIEVRSFSPIAPGWCWYVFISPCTVAKCCFVHQVYCWDVATNSPRVCQWWTITGNTVECDGQSNFDPQQVMPSCGPPYMLLWRSGCRAYECQY